MVAEQIMSYYPEPDTHRQSQRQSSQRQSQSSVRIVKLCYEKELKDATSVDKSNSAAKKRFYYFES